MSRVALVVYREYLGCFEEAGHLAPSDEGVVFAYSESYLQNETAHAISQALPLQVEAFSPRARRKDAKKSESDLSRRR